MTSALPAAAKLVALPAKICPVAPPGAQQYADQLMGYVLWGSRAAVHPRRHRRHRRHRRRAGVLHAARQQGRRRRDRAGLRGDHRLPRPARDRARHDRVRVRLMTATPHAEPRLGPRDGSWPSSDPQRCSRRACSPVLISLALESLTGPDQRVRRCGRSTSAPPSTGPARRDADRGRTDAAGRPAPRAGQVCPPPRSPGPRRAAGDRGGPGWCPDRVPAHPGRGGRRSSPRSTPPC